MISPLPLISVVLATVTWYLTSMAQLTKGLWSRYPKWLDEWASCPACSGAWWNGLWTAILAHALGWDWFGVPLPWSAVLGVLWGCFWVPLGAWMLARALREVHGNEDE